MLDARQYQVKDTLKNGLEVCIRASRPDDIDLAIQAFHELDPQSIYTRYFMIKKALSDADIRMFREADFKTRVILLCTLIKNGQEIVIATATYVCVGEREAEVAFVVEEDYQRLGISRRLLGHLQTIASSAGITRFVAEVLPENDAMLGVFSRCGWPMTAEACDGTVHVTLALPTGG